jgi:hypothetical protein
VNTTERANTPSPILTEPQASGSYNHGFDLIYSLETIDAKTVRKMGSASDSAVPSASPIHLEKNALRAHAIDIRAAQPQPIEATFFVSEQLTLPFAVLYGQESSEPFKWHEPIHVLKLSSQAQQRLLDSGKSRIRDIICIDLSQLKGFGQGHIDEIRQKLAAYCGQETRTSPEVDFASLIRCIVGDLEAQSSSLFLSQYGLEKLVSLSQNDVAAMRHLSITQRQEMQQALCRTLMSADRRQLIEGCLLQVVQRWIWPWMHLRLKIATRFELDDRLEVLALDPARVKPVIDVLGALYFESGFPLEKWLHEVEEGVYCADAETASAYREVIVRAKSYFYRAGLHYPLPHLITLLECEFASQWQGFAEGFVEKVIVTSALFSARKENPGLRIVRRR